MPQVNRKSYRGDDRDDNTVKSHGGFVPKFLLSQHARGFDGYLECTNKTDGKMGCKCAGMSEAEMYNKARKYFLQLMQKPIDLQGHVMYNSGGLISTANLASEAYAGHQYEISSLMYEYSLQEAVKRFRIQAKLPALVNGWKVYLNKVDIGQSTLIAITPKGKVELTYITPIAYEHLRYLGKT